MTTFKDGPAKGQTLMLRRAAMFLRVVQDPNGEWDALDQLGDTPKPGERLYAYKITFPVHMAHYCMGGGRGGMYPVASYSLVEPQPTDQQMRTEPQWDAWCKAQVQKEKPTP